MKILMSIKNHQHDNHLADEKEHKIMIMNLKSLRDSLNVEP